MTKSRNLGALLREAPTVHEGCRGVSAEMDALRRYILEHGLCWADKSAITAHVLSVIGSVYETSSYSPGSRNRCSHYGRGHLTGHAELEAALICKPSGLKATGGLVHTIPEPGVREEYRYTGSAWVRVRRWCKLRGRDLIVTGKPRRVGRWTVQRAREKGRAGYWYVEHTGGLTAKRTRTVVRSWFSPRTFADAAQRRWQGGTRHPATVTVRLLSRICPPAYEVVTTPPSEGAEPSPALRERTTGEEYHYTSTITHRRPVAEARQAFARRAAIREETALRELIERGEADNIYVCASDSYRVGNCREGTSTFARRHDLDIRRHYRVGELAALANGDSRFVRAACIAACRREREEMRQGYCVVAEHTA